MKPLLQIEQLTKEHDVSNFDCFSGYDEDLDLNDFIKNDALKQKEEGWNRTYVATEIGSKKVIGFFAIAQDSFRVKNDLKEEHGKPYWQIPAIKIGRLAVDKQYHGLGVGKFILSYAIGYITKEIYPKLGGLYITLDSYPHRVNWYKEKFNFRQNTLIKQGETTYQNLILPIKDFKMD